MRVIITDHAMDRWMEHTKQPRKRRGLAYIVKRHLKAALRSGVEPKTGALHIEVFPWLVAVCVNTGLEYKVVTFYVREKARSG